MNNFASHKSDARIAGDVAWPEARPGLESTWRGRTVAKRALQLFALALGVTVTIGAAHAVPSPENPNTTTPPFLYDYYTSLDEPAAMGALNGSNANQFNAGGLCPEVTSNAPTGCATVSSLFVGPSLVGGSLTTSALIPITPFALTDGDSNYLLTFILSDLGGHSASYEITLDGSYLGMANSADNYTIFDTLTDGVKPGSYTLGITNMYLANTSAVNAAYTSDKLSFTVTEADVPEPGSLAIVATGFGLLGLLRRYRAGV